MIKRPLLFSSLLLTGALHAHAQKPNWNNYEIDRNAGINEFYYDCTAWEVVTYKCQEIRNKLNTEIPYWIIGGGGEWRSYFYTDGASSYIISIPKDLVSNNSLRLNDGVGPTEIASPLSGCPAAIPVPADLNVHTNATGTISKATHSIDLTDGFEANANYTAAIVNGLMSGQDWKRSYYNIWSSHFIESSQAGPISLGFLHAENKAKCGCPSTVSPYNPIVNDPYYCEYDGDYFPTRGNFVCATWVKNDASTNYGQANFNNDMGPIVWPSNGYEMENGLRISTGTGGPSSIIYDQYVYVFYIDHGPFAWKNAYPVPQEEGRAEGVKVIRAPIFEALTPSAWRAYYKDPNGNVSWNPALPAGFDKNNIDLFWNRKGPKATDLMGDELNNRFESNRFSVAKVRNATGFIGIETYMTGNGFAFALRYSEDLLNWSERYVIDEGQSWDNVNLGYAVFLDFAGWTNNEVDINNFFIMGKKPAADGGNDQYVRKYHIYNKFPARIATKASSEKTSTIKAGIIPTPNTGSFRLNYQLTSHSKVQINVFDVMGRKLYTVAPGVKGAGNYSENINIGSQNKGMYIVELIVDGKKEILKTIKN